MFVSFKRKFLGVCLLRRKLRGSELMACWKAELLCQQQEGSLECPQDRLFGSVVVVTSLPDDCNCFWPSYPAVGASECWPVSRIVTSLSHTCGTDFIQQRSLLATSPDWEYVLLLSGTVWVSKAYAQGTLLIGARAGHTRTELDHFKMTPCWRNRRRQPFVTRILPLIYFNVQKMESNFFSNSITYGEAEKKE